MQGRSTTFPSHCGSVILHDFITSNKVRFPSKLGCKTLFSIFINRDDQHKAYLALTKKYKILYQSPALVNPKTRHEYFIVIFLNEKP